MSKALLVLGAGGHGKAVAEAALLSQRWERVVFLDDGRPKNSVVLGCKVVGKIDSISGLADQFSDAIAAVGNNKIREKWVGLIEQTGLTLVSVVHPFAWSSPSAVIGSGSAVMAGAVLGTDCFIGKGSIVNANATVDHDVRMDAFGHLGVGVQLAGGVQIGSRAWLQAGVSCGYNVVVPEDAVLEPGTSKS